MADDEYYEVDEIDLIYESHDKIDALVELLIEKGVITQDEYEKKLAKVVEENEALFEAEE